MTDAKELNWYFVEFIKVLIALSLPAKEQFDAYGDGTIGKEMADDFKSNYADNKKEFLENGQILEIHITELDKLEKYLKSKDNNFFDDPQLLYDDKGWNEVRSLAKNCIKVMEMEHLGIESNIVEEPSVDDEGEEVIFQIVQINIVDKTNNK